MRAAKRTVLLIGGGGGAGGVTTAATIRQRDSAVIKTRAGLKINLRS